MSPSVVTVKQLSSTMVTLRADVHSAGQAGIDLLNHVRRARVQTDRSYVRLGQLEDRAVAWITEYLSETSSAGHPFHQAVTDKDLAGWKRETLALSALLIERYNDVEDFCNEAVALTEPLNTWLSHVEHDELLQLDLNDELGGGVSYEKVEATTARIQGWARRRLGEAGQAVANLDDFTGRWTRIPQDKGDPASRPHVTLSTRITDVKVGLVEAVTSSTALRTAAASLRQRADSPES